MTPEKVRKIRDLYWNHEVPVTKLAEHFQISRPYCVQIVTYKRWRQPEMFVPKTNNFAIPEPILPSRKLEKPDVKEIRRLYSQGKMNMRQLAKSYGVVHSTIVRVIHKDTHRYDSKEDIRRERNAARMRNKRIQKLQSNE